MSGQLLEGRSAVLKLCLAVVCAWMLLTSGACSSSPGRTNRTATPAIAAGVSTPDPAAPDVTDTAVVADPTRAPRRSQEPELRAAATGTWVGDFGSLAFFGDGTAKFVVKICGTSAVSAKDKPFNVITDCDPKTIEGVLTIGEHSFTLADASSVETAYQAYVDAAGQLHVGSGTLDELDQNRKGVVTIFGKGDLIVDNACRYKPPSTPVSAPVKCTFDEQQGQPVLTALLPPLDTGAPADEVRFVYVPASGLIVAPALYLAAFHREP